MLVADVAGFNRVGACVNAEHQVDDVPQRNVGGVWAVPASPANVITNAILRQSAERMIEGLDANAFEFLEFAEWRLGIDHVPVVRQARIVDLENNATASTFSLYSSRLDSSAAKTNSSPVL